MSNPGVAEQLTNLAKLHTEGSISETDFKALKAKLIAGVKDREKNGTEEETLKKILSEVAQIRRNYTYETVAGLLVFGLIVMAWWSFNSVLECRVAFTGNNFNSRTMDGCIRGIEDKLARELIAKESR